VGKRANTGREDNPARDERITIEQRDPKAFARLLNMRHVPSVDVAHGMLLKPESVLNEPLERNRRANLLFRVGVKRVEGQDAVRIRQIRSHVRRTQQHAFGHVAFPEIHRLPENAHVQTGDASEVRCRGKSVGARTHNREIANHRWSSDLNGNRAQVVSIRLSHTVEVEID
jgi:hypothetical protein